MTARVLAMPSDRAPFIAGDESSGHATPGARGDSDPAAWGATVERHQHTVLVALLARGVPLERAKELVQETWLRLMEKQRHGGLASVSMPGLALAQARFLALTFHRRSGREVLGNDEASEADSVAVRRLGGEPSPEDRVIQRQELTRVAAAFAACPAAARRVFAFIYDHPELSYAEAAQELRLSEQRVKQVVCEVRRRLREALREEVDEP